MLIGAVLSQRMLTAMTDKNEPGYKVAADGHKYHKSATANATTAPTNDATVASAEKTTGLNAEQAEFVTIIDYEWNLKHDIGLTAICEEYGFTEAEFKAYASHALVVAALEERGIKAKFFNPDPAVETRSKLSAIQLIVANSMLNLTDTRPPKKKLQDCGVTPYQYQSWLKDPDFKQYMVDVSEGLLNDVQHEVLLSLIDKAAGGDLGAIKYYNEMTGRFVESSKTNTGGSAVDFQQMIVRIIEIVVDEVDDPNTAARIADKLKGLVMGNQVAGLIETPITQPEIAEARHLTLAQNAAVNRGIGVNE